MSLGLKVWFDIFILRIGDSLRRKINKGLKESQYGVVILSENFFSKEWPQKELDGLTALETGSRKVILPVWHDVDSRRIRDFSPILADRVGISTSRGIVHVAHEIYSHIKVPPDVRSQTKEGMAFLRSSNIGLKLLRVLNNIPKTGGIYRRHLSVELDIDEYETRLYLLTLLDHGLIIGRKQNGRDVYYLSGLGKSILEELEK
jgi:predicted transcriptional regulator